MTPCGSRGGKNCGGAICTLPPGHAGTHENWDATITWSDRTAVTADRPGRDGEHGSIRDQLRAASERHEALPAYARPIVTRPVAARPAGQDAPSSPVTDQAREEIAQILLDWAKAVANHAEPPTPYAVTDAVLATPTLRRLLGSDPS